MITWAAVVFVFVFVVTVTLPAADSFWDTYYPPNGWNCRCTVAEVLRDKYPESDHNEAMRLGGEALSKDTKGMFAFNPGKQCKVFPDYNPYTISRCKNCPKTQGNLASGVPDNQLCEACSVLVNMVKKEESSSLTSADAKRIRQTVTTWANEHLPEVKMNNGQKAKRLIIKNGADSLVVNKRFFSETFAKNVRHKELAKTMEMSTRIEAWLPGAVLVRKEAGEHHNCDFLVYEASYDNRTIECKVKDQGEKMVYTMRIKNKD